MKNITIIPVKLNEANEFVKIHHRHNNKVTGHKFSLGALMTDVNVLVGVVIVGRPTSRNLDNGSTLEVTRLCVTDNAPKNLCSFLYSRAWRIVQLMGYTKLITFTLTSESGSSLKAAGFKIIHQTKGKNSWVNRPNRQTQDIYYQDKFRWEIE